jgi:hypothetical protein
MFTLALACVLSLLPAAPGSLRASMLGLLGSGIAGFEARHHVSVRVDDLSTAPILHELLRELGYEAA